MGSLLTLLLLAVGIPTSQSTEPDWILVKGTVVFVTDSGAVVHCERSSGISSLAEGNLFLRGVEGVSDSDSVHCRATKTDEFTKYTNAEGTVVTLRIYDYLSPVSSG